MKLVKNIVGVVLTLLGLLWILQGTGVIAGGVMGGQIQWAVIGLVVGAVGVGLLVLTNRKLGGAAK
jgi:hypothetical protein